ncbi:MAG: retropepsin-like aspartic protease [Burkholderiaceae bacterium]
MKHLLCAALLALAASVQAQSVALSGIMGNRALLVVDGSAPRAVPTGETHQGVKLISAFGESAVVEIGGKRHTLRVGEAPVSVGAGAGVSSRGSRIVLTADRGGHFYTQGTINGRSVNFMVDTGATVVAMGAAEADRIGLNYKAGQQVRMSTANGVAPAYMVKLNSVRINDVEIFQVDAAVIPQPMPYLLLGNSFLSRFQMKRENDQMTLDQRY